jgi:formate hydrogenlyase subunit 6/NADH:ubiquinone oxidoreductase subunit I
LPLSDEAQGTSIYAAEAIKKMCLEARADDVGLVDLDRESLQMEREGILYVYPLTRSLLCNQCSAVCPTGAVTKGQPFDFMACLTHAYRDNMAGFLNWVESVVNSQNMEEYRTHFDDRETALM